MDVGKSTVLGRAWHVAVKRPFGTVMSALLVAGGITTAIVGANGKTVQAASYSGCGYGYAGASTTNYAFGYGACAVTSTSTSTSTSAPAASTPSTTLPPAPPPVVTTGAQYGQPSSVTVSGNTSTTVTSQPSNRSASATVNVPKGALPANTTVSVYPVTYSAATTKVLPAGDSYLVSFAVTWESKAGSVPKASAPITITITDSSIVAGDTVYEMTPSGPVKVGVATANGSVVVSFRSDPVFVVAATPQLRLDSRQGTLVGSALRLRFSCATSAPCRVEGRVNVTRKSASGAYRHVILSRATFVLPAGSTRMELLRLNRVGAALIPKNGHHFGVGLVTFVTGGVRSGVKVFVP